MNRNPAVLVAIGLLGVLAATDCDGDRGTRPEYVTKKDFEELRSQFAATHDTMLALWSGTDSLNKIFGLFVTGKYGAYPVPPPPKCPPICRELIPRKPQPIGR